MTASGRHAVLEAPVPLEGSFVNVQGSSLARSRCCIVSYQIALADAAVYEDRVQVRRSLQALQGDGRVQRDVRERLLEVRSGQGARVRSGQTALERTSYVNSPPRIWRNVSPACASKRRQNCSKLSSPIPLPFTRFDSNQAAPS